MKKVMIIAPHHDDETIGCGGSICLHKQKGDEIIIVFVVAGWSGIPWESDKKRASTIIQNEAKMAGKILDIDRIIELNLEDRNLSVSHSMLLPLITAIREVSPEIIYIPYPNDGDYEHRLVSIAAREAIWISATDYFPEAGCKKTTSAKLILGYEVWRPIENYQLAVDITAYAKKKKNAIRAYKSQIKQKKWEKAVAGLNQFRGITSGKGEYVEVFQVIKADDKLFKD